MARTGIWFAWHPVRLGALATGRLVWLMRVWRCRCMGVAIYQPEATNVPGGLPLNIAALSRKERAAFEEGYAMGCHTGFLLGKKEAHGQ